MIEQTTETESQIFSEETELELISSPQSLTVTGHEYYKTVILGRLAKELFCGVPLSKIKLPRQRNPFKSHIRLKNARIRTRSGERLGAWVVCTSSRRPSHWVLVLHGNSTNRYTFSYLYEVERLVEEGVGVLIVDYRGFADSEGQPSKKAFVEDVAASVSYLKKRGVTSFGILGYSLGTAIALEYLGKYYARVKHRKSFEITRLVLVSPFISTVTLLQEYKLWNAIEAMLPASGEYAMFGLGYDSLKNIQRVSMPILIIHGTADWLIPWHHSKVLSEASGARFIKVHNESHNTVFRHAETWKYIADFFTEAPQQ